MNWRRFSLVVCLALALLLTVNKCFALADTGDGEREFVQQLLDRGLFSLAEQFCEEHLKKSANANDRFDWELILSDISQQHAWHVAEDSRGEMVSLAAQRITDFQKANTSTPERDLQLRVRQVELLVSIGVMEDTLRAGVSGAAGTAPSQVEKVQTTQKTPRGSVQFALDATSQARQLAESLLKQIDQIRRDIDADVARGSKERLRFAMAQIEFVRSRLQIGDQSVTQREQSKLIAEQLLKSTSDDSLRFRTRLLLAEIQLDQKDFAAFSLKFGGLLSTTATPEERSIAAALKIRSLLRQGQPSEALQEFVTASQSGLAMTQEIQTARLQSLLQLMELLDQLEDSSQTAELKKKTATEFFQLKDKTISLTSGVWRERCLRISDRFDRVQQVGSKAASTLEEVASLVDAGNVAAAQKLLQSLIQQFDTRRPRELASLFLQSGNLSIREREWRHAIGELERSRQLFQDVQNRDRAAAADLLRVYALGQLWDSGADSTVTESDYKTALDEHVSTFEGEATTARAREWRARLLRSSDPLTAVKELLEAQRQTVSSTDAAQSSSLSVEQRMALLVQVGDHLLEAMERLTVPQPVGTSAGELDVLCEQFNTAVSEVQGMSDDSSKTATSDQNLKAQNQRLSGDVMNLILTIQESGLSLRKPLDIRHDWKAMETDSRGWLAKLTELQPSLMMPGGIVSDSRAPSSQTTAETSDNISAVASNSSQSVGRDNDRLLVRSITICNALICLSSFRQLADSTTFGAQKGQLFDQPFEERFLTVRQLLTQIPTSGRSVPGDSQLALFLMEMTTASSSDNIDRLTFAQRLDALQILKRLSSVTGSMATYQSRLEAMISMPLTDAQLASLIEVVATEVAPETAASGASVTNSATGKKFWQSVQKMSKPGQPGWFEAALQLAALEASNGNQGEAKRILGVVGVLHPDWGSPSRKARADELLKKLEAKP